MSISLTELQRWIGEEEAKEREAKRALVDPFKQKRAEPGRARPAHNGFPPRSASLGGDHS